MVFLWFSYGLPMKTSIFHSSIGGTGPAGYREPTSHVTITRARLHTPLAFGFQGHVLRLSIHRLQLRCFSTDPLAPTSAADSSSARSARRIETANPNSSPKEHPHPLRKGPTPRCRHSHHLSVRSWPCEPPSMFLRGVTRNQLISSHVVAMLVGISRPPPRSHPAERSAGARPRSARRNSAALRLRRNGPSPPPTCAHGPPGLPTHAPRRRRTARDVPWRS
mmetsp:Transcript_19489/g.43040  ORF Transcript_19489/g.43040 Transcript_19489/m.43040 type:complete len:221 (+) Transcript_19489:53-715(+)